MAPTLTWAILSSAPVLPRHHHSSHVDLPLLRPCIRAVGVVAETRERKERERDGGEQCRTQDE